MIIPAVRRVRSVAVLSALAAALSVSPAAAQLAGIPVGSTPPQAHVVTLAGQPVELAAALGQGPVVLEFWATWCPLCRALEPQFEALEKRHPGVRVIRVGVRDNQTPEQQRDYVEKHGFTGTHLFDRDGEAARAFAVPHTSYVVVLDAAGKVAYTGVGKEQDLEAALARAMPSGE